MTNIIKIPWTESSMQLYS